MDDGRVFCEQMLPKVSRTFALCIRLLPPSVEYPVLVAYLLCRIADTIEDAPGLPGEEKRALLEQFRRCLEIGGPAADALRDAFADARNDEEHLAARADVVLAQFRALPVDRQESIRPWVQEMCDGMARFAAMRAGATTADLHALNTVDDLEQYCYYVAGTVGHLLTALFRSGRRRINGRRYARLETLATSFGLGLQLTNIIKDVADDQRRGWSFVPRELCQIAGIDPDQLHNPRYRPQARRVMHTLIEKARRHLQDALDYCLTLPRTQYRIRLFCLTSMLFAVRTLRLAEGDPRLLDPAHKVKISRKAVYGTLATTVVCAGSNTLVRAYYQRLAGG